MMDTASMTALSIFQPQFCTERHGHEQRLAQELTVIKRFLGVPKAIVEGKHKGVQVEPLLNSSKLEEQSRNYLFLPSRLLLRWRLCRLRRTGRRTVTVTYLFLAIFCRLMTKSAERIHLVSEFTRGLHLVTVMVNGSEEDERLFSAMNRVKNGTRNRLSIHLQDAVSSVAQPKFTLETFPFNDAVHHWKHCMNVVRMGDLLAPDTASDSE